MSPVVDGRPPKSAVRPAPPSTDEKVMALSQVGSAADEATSVADTIRRREVLVPRQIARHPDDDVLLEAIRRSLVPGDPVARLLAGWTAPPARPVATHAVRSAPAPRSG
jgi:hypothetical protein